MVINRGSFILLELSDELFDRQTPFSLFLKEICVLEGKLALGTPELNLYKDVEIRYTVLPTPRLSIIRGSVAIKTYYKQSTTIANFKRILLHGEVYALTPAGLEISQAQPVDLGDRYIKINQLNGCDIVYRGNQPQDGYINLYADDTLAIELNVQKKIGYTYRGIDIGLKIFTRRLGYLSGGSVDIPYIYNESTKKIIIPACLIFADYEFLTEEATPSEISVSLELKENENYVVNISGKNVLITDGFTVSEAMNETLDSGIIKFISKMSLIDIEQFDTVTIENDEMNISRKKQLVDTFRTTVVEYNDENIFDSNIEYTVSLFSETKILERIPLPNLTITRRADNPKTVYQKVLEYCHLYLPRVNIYDPTNGVESHCCLKLDSSLVEKLDVECPELQWNNPTLREVLNDLFSVANLIPVVKDNVLSYFDLHRRGNEIDESYITDFGYEGVSSDYCDELYVPINNVIQKGSTIINEYLPLTAEGARFDNENIVIATSKPINRIISVIAYVKYEDYNLRKSSLRPVDITNFVIEKSEYDAKSPVNEFRSGSHNISDYNSFYIYFERGNRNIKGVMENTRIITGIMDRNFAKIELTIDAANTSSGKVENMLFPSFANISDTFVKVEYEAIDETVVSFGKKYNIKNSNNRLFDGQANSIVDIEKQAQQEYSKVERFGNAVLNIYGSYTDETKIPQLSDKIGEWVLFSRELQYFNDVILFHGRLCKNYVLQNYFAGILNEKRIFQLVQNTEATTRHENIKFYVCACFNEDKIHSDYDAGELGVYKINKNINAISQSLKIIYVYAINNTLFQNDEIIANYEGDSNVEFAMNANYESVGRSFVIDTGFYDNIVSGNGVLLEGESRSAIPYTYTDENGEFSNVHFDLVNSYNSGDGEFNFDAYVSSLYPEVDPSEFDESKYQSLLEKTREKPKVSKAGIDTNKTHITIDGERVYKDNSERMKFTIQFELISGSTNLIVKDKFMKAFSYSPNKEVEPHAYDVYIARNDKYDEVDIYAKGDVVSSALNFSSSTSDDYFELKDSIELTNDDCWCVANSRGEILIAVNGNHRRVNFDIMANRDSKVYNNIIDKEAIGNLHNSLDQLDTSLIDHPSKVRFISVMGRILNIDDTLDIEDELERF